MSILTEIYLEACAEGVDDAIRAAQTGIHRIELCSALQTGGVTPSIASIEATVQNVNVPVHVLIRPRPGDFLYSGVEFNIMLQDIKLAKKAGAAGVVFGILNPDGTVDIERNTALIKAAGNMEKVFHRAFDMVADPYTSVETIIGMGFNSVLTSGLRQSAEDGLDTIKELVKRVGNRIHVIAGGGISASNLDLITESGVKWIHFSVSKKIPSKMSFQNPDIERLGSKQESEYTGTIFDQEKLNAILIKSGNK